MMLRTHAAFALLIGMLSLKYLNVPSTFFFLAMVCIASMLADIDSSNSKIGRKLPALSWFIERAFGHRNFFHSIFPLIAVAVILFYFLDWNVAGAAFLIGYGSHLFTDSFTRMGVGIFHPFYRKRITGFIRTGSLTEYFIFFLLLALNLMIIWKYHLSQNFSFPWF